MRRPPTLVLEQDDEGTAIDLRFVELARSSETTEVAREADESTPPMRDEVFGRRRFAAIVVTVLLIALLIAATYRERRIANNLRRAIHAIERDLKTRVTPRSSADKVMQREEGSVVRSVTELMGDDRDELERQSAELLARNNFEEALSYYRTLATRFPESAEFSHFVTVLETKLHCRTKRRSPGSACD